MLSYGASKFQKSSIKTDGAVEVLPRGRVVT